MHEGDHWEKFLTWHWWWWRLVMCEHVSMPLEHAHCALEKKKKKKDAEDEKEQEKKSDQCTVTLVHSVLWCTPQTGAQCALCSGAHHRLVHSALCALVHTTDWCRDWCTVCSVLWCTPQTGAGTGAQCALCSGAHHRLVHSALCALVHTTDWCRDWCTVLCKGMHVDWGHRWMSSWQQTKLFLRRFCEKRERGC